MGVDGACKYITGISADAEDAMESTCQQYRLSFFATWITDVSFASAMQHSTNSIPMHNINTFRCDNDDSDSL